MPGRLCVNPVNRRPAVVGEGPVHLWMFLLKEGCKSTEQSVGHTSALLFIALLLRNTLVTRSPRIWFMCTVNSKVLSDLSTSGAYPNHVFSRRLGLLDQLRCVPKALERHVIRQGVGRGFTWQLLKVNVVELE